MMTLATALERIADLEDQVALLEHDFGRTLALLTALGEAAGLTAPPVSHPEVPALRLLPGGRGDRKRVAGSAASRVTPSAAPRHASTPGMAS
jgi:hypothetical protein